MADVRDDFGRFEEMMNRMFENFWGRPRRQLLSSGERGEMLPAEYRQPSIDVVETDREVIARAEMPGLDKENIKINLTEDRLEISAETNEEEEKKEKGYVYREMRSGSYYRAIALPSPVDPNNAQASYKNGILEIKMPKTEVKEKKEIKVE
jgi:HSP20 family protein